MDIAIGSTAGRDAVRAWLRAGTEVSDAELQSRWDTAVTATSAWINTDATVDAPQAVVDFVTAVAADLWRAVDSGGQLQPLPDGTVSGASIHTALVRRNAVIGGPYVHAPRTIA